MYLTPVGYVIYLLEHCHVLTVPAIARHWYVQVLGL
jgi:hypothetical protein